MRSHDAVGFLEYLLHKGWVVVRINLVVVISVLGYFRLGLLEFLQANGVGWVNLDEANSSSLHVLDTGEEVFEDVAIDEGLFRTWRRRVSMTSGEFLYNHLLLHSLEYFGGV